LNEKETDMIKMILAGVGIAAVVAIALMAPDIRRYIRISSM
jgi:hypothetical protein